MKKRIIVVAISIIIIAIVGILIYFYIDFQTEKRNVETFYKNYNPNKIKDFGRTKTLEILPLVEWYADDKNLKTEPGLSYLIRTDEAQILFDTGLSSKNEPQTPLLNNMKVLEINAAAIDSIVLSHNHSDHNGGLKFGNSPFSGKTVYSPVDITSPGLHVQLTGNPTTIAKGVTTTGALPSSIFFSGKTLEQVLAINVDNKGIVLIIGCGHQTVPKIIEQVEKLFNKPVYAIIGGLHYPVTDSRMKIMGIPVQKIYGTGKPPWNFITKQDVKKDIELIKNLNPQIVALSPHDSCDTSLKAFKEAFLENYKEVKVGKKIYIDNK